MSKRKDSIVAGDRRVHCTISTYDGARIEIVRYDRAGRWYYEHSIGYRRGITLAEAVGFASSVRPAVTWHEGVPGGRTFDARVRAARKEGK